MEDILNPKKNLFDRDREREQEKAQGGGAAEREGGASSPHSREPDIGLSPELKAGA